MNKWGKMMLRAGLAAMALGMAGSASAAQFLITYRGVVETSENHTNSFGLTGLFSLDGQAYTAEYTLTTPGGAVNTNGSTFARVQGFDFAGNPGFVPVSARLTINGISFSTPAPNGVGVSFGSAQQENNHGIFHHDGVRHSASFGFDHLDSDNNVQRFNGFISSQIISVNDFTNGIDYTNSLNYTAQANDNSFSLNTTTFGEFALNEGVRGRPFILAVNGHLRAQSVTIAPLGIAAVPEPASWALMIAGFGVVGAGMRRRRGSVRVTYA
jgi:PEP-CTERM motif